MTSDHIIDSIKKHPASITVQQLMFTETQFNPKLRSITDEHEVDLLFPYNKYVATLIKQILILILILMLKYYIPSYPNYNIEFFPANKSLEIQTVRETIEKILGWIMKMKVKK